MHCLRSSTEGRLIRRQEEGRGFLLVFLASPESVTRSVFSFFQHSAPLTWQHFVVGIFKHWTALASSFGYRYGAVSQWLQVVTKSLLSTYMWKLTHFNKEHPLLNRKKCQALFSYATKSCNKSLDLHFQAQTAVPAELSGPQHTHTGSLLCVHSKSILNCSWGTST